IRPKFELPKSPASIVNDEERAESDAEHDDVDYVASYVADQSQTMHSSFVPHLTTNLVPIPLLLATPPQSPCDAQQQSEMPTLRALLSSNKNNNNNKSGSNAIGNLSPEQPVQVNCFVCQQPFTDYDALRQHLTLHAAQLNMHLSNPDTPVAATCPLPPPSYTLQMPLPNYTLDTPSPPLPEPAAAPKSTADCIRFQCEVCNMVLCSEHALHAHQRSHLEAQQVSEQPRRKFTLKVFRCDICKRGYKRELNLRKHMRIRHGVKAHDVAPRMPPRLVAKPRPTEGQKRMVWSTNLLNAVAAANYNPAKETSAKYLPPTERGNGQRQKYALRSPYCNP
ncbi:hypothetical protein KR222_009730, partial [Zaprionus bogoriensis]